MALSEDLGRRAAARASTQGAAYALELAVIGAIYFALAKIGLMLASINPSASPIWPSTGFALAALILRGLPGLAGDPGRGVRRQRLDHRRLPCRDLARDRRRQHVEAPAGRLSDQPLSDGKATFETPAGVARFALLSFLPTALCATIGVTSLAAGGLAERAAFGSVWLTWWLGDLAGALLVTPVIVLWAAADLRRRQLAASCSNRSSSSASPAWSA